MALLDELRKNREKILAIAKDCGLKDVRVFGSVARGQEREDSDIDILVNRIKDVNMGLQIFGFPVALEEIFHRKIDFVFEPTLHWVIKDDVLKEAKPI
ncbi:MAG: nucleotidyltransferase domain-containing protein [Pseudomonadota bacterium]